MPRGLAHKPRFSIRIRRAKPRDMDALMDLEHRVFATDRLSRRSLRHLLHAPTAEVLVADADGRFAGTAIVLFRAGSRLARLYSVAVAPHMGGRGIAALLLDAAEDRARARKCRAIRLEVHETNHRAISRYHKSGYREFGRHPAYYEDGGDALRFEKPIVRETPGPRVGNPASKNP
jgi:[ribosomal protein S18]-alanine N-acetyltransferase